MIPYGRQSITAEDIAAVTQVLQSDFLTQGPSVSKFEANFAEFVGSKYAVAVTNGTAALHLSALALGVEKGQTVITSPNTFVASANCAEFCGGDVAFADINPETLCLDPQKVEDLIRKSGHKMKFTGIIPVSFAGNPVKLDDFRTIADKYNLWIVEDACHSPGASFKTRNGTEIQSGSCAYSDMAVFSFHPVKHIACGEGGMITTNDEKHYQKLLKFRTHGITKKKTECHRFDGDWYYEMQELGYNYRISDILCALGNSQLSRLKPNVARRIEIADMYRRGLSGIPVKVPTIDSDVTHAYHLFVIETDERKALYEHLKKKDIYCQVHYIPVYRQPYYESKYGNQSLPHMDHYYSRCLSIPMYHSMTDQNVSYVIESIKSFFSK